MIWNIFKKDFAQLWLLSALVAIAHLTNAAFWFALGPFKEPHGLVIVAQVFSFLALLGNLTLITSLVHQEALSDVSQDWLIRPIRRRDLLFSKLLFLLVIVHGPMLLADLAHPLAQGFLFRDALAAALSRNIFVLLAFSLPMFAIATITRTLVQGAAALVATWFVVVVGMGLGILIRGGSAPVFAANGIQWMTPAFWSLLAFFAAIVVIPLQYFRRTTFRARSIVATTVLLAPLLSLSTWAAAFSLQQRLSPNSALAEPIAIAFYPGLRRSTAETDSPSHKEILLPVRVSGLPPESFLMNDHTEIRLIGRDGATLYRGRTVTAIGYEDDFPIRTMAGGDVVTYQRIELPDKLPDQVITQPVRVEIEYSLTLFNLADANTIPAANGDGRFAAFGLCRTKLDNDGDDIELGCEKTGAAPACISVTLENPNNGLRNPENLSCDPDYAPYTTHVFPDSMSQFGGGIKFRDLQGLAKYPVDRSQLGEARVILKSYRPTAHFTRRLVIPDIRLDEWISDATADHARSQPVIVGQHLFIGSSVSQGGALGGMPGTALLAFSSE